MIWAYAFLILVSLCVGAILYWFLSDIIKELPYYMRIAVGTFAATVVLFLLSYPIANIYLLAKGEHPSQQETVIEERQIEHKCPCGCGYTFVEKEEDE